MKLHLEYGDTNFIGLVNADRYQSFVGEDWELSMLLQHFADEMKKGNILVCQMTEEGIEHSWTVEVTFEEEFTVEHCYRRAAGYIQVTDGLLVLVDYTCLTMAAQFDDCAVPDENCSTYTISLKNGMYKVHIVQFYNADREEYVGGDGAELIINFTEVHELGANEEKVIWCSYT
ncbi:hypothetical protein [Paenibacillus sp. MER 99-2]|uniref:hypothetical protein n=1 Tax=Paenibacillus sp. MER 99-2 TaxID=2939572 RepID=UPI00203D658C|nr:hypothetical protein [Paenibacillus sp. MER 99-2]MCM3173013.1 hypothetical protein [Paenibacillus sp. MER 99-2]